MNSDRKITIFICIFAIIFGITIKVLPHFYFISGKNALEKQDYTTAYKNLKKSYQLDKNNKDYRYFYVQSLLNLSPSITVQKEIFEIAASNRDDSAKQLAESKISDWRNNILYNIGDNYIEQVPLDKGIIRWSDFPIKFIITNNDNINIPQYYTEEITKAFSQWQNSTGFIKFEQTQNLSDANIIVKISQIPSNICSDGVCRYIVGFTVPNIKGNILKDMTITLYATDPNKNFFSDKELFNTILHEIGHALGIMGHSYSSEDLMYMSSENNTFYTPYRSSFQYLSSKDINTVELLYKLLPTITNNKSISTKGLIYPPVVLGTSNEISLRKLKEAQSYVKNAPDLSNGYIDMGIAYAELNRNKDSIKAFKKAYSLSKTNDEKYLALYNLSTACLNNKQYDSALTYAQQAKELIDTEEIKDLISNINHSKILNK